MNFKQALEELRKTYEKRNFDQTLDLIVNLKNFDPRRDILNTFVILPHPPRKKKIAAFLDKITKSDVVSKIFFKDDIDKISLKEMKKIAREYDYFMASAKLMPSLAAKFGKALGTIGKMPDPKIGCVLMQEQPETLETLAKQLEKTVKIKAKENSLKIPLGKESMSDEQLLENINTTFKIIIAALPKKELNMKNVMLKLTMSEPVKVKLDEKIETKGLKNKK
jgi:large subunit ribosomal protein L1